jgi:hypothetical protein
LFHEQGQDRQALQEARKALELVANAPLAGSTLNAVRRRTRLREALALIGLGKGDEAARVIAEIEKASAAAPDDAEITTDLHLLRGELAASKKDFDEAIRELGRCEVSGLTDWGYDYREKANDVYCRWRMERVSRQAGKTEAANALRTEILHHYTRDPQTLYVQGRLLHEKQ